MRDARGLRVDIAVCLNVERGGEGIDDGRWTNGWHYTCDTCLGAKA